MEVKEAIRLRRSVRSYRDVPVPNEAVLELIDAAIRAPSANNSQPWSFVVIQDKAMLKRLSDRAKAIALADVGVDAAHGRARHLVEPSEFNCFYDAGTLILILAEQIGPHPDWDCCFAAQNLMLAARAMGLGSCPIGVSWPVFEIPEVREELGIPSECRVILPIIVGTPVTLPDETERRKPKIHSWLREVQKIR